MDFLHISKQELLKLMGLPYIQQSTYVLGIRPFMDWQTGIVGTKRRISYQSLSEALYIEPHSGIKSGSPSRQQIRRVIKGLERAGLVEIKSCDMHLVLKLPLASLRYSVENKADTNPAHQSEIENLARTLEYAEEPSLRREQVGNKINIEADTPQIKENNSNSPATPAWV